MARQSIQSACRLRETEITIAILYASLLHIGGVETHLLSLLRHSDQSRYRWLVVGAASSPFQAQAEASSAQIIYWKPAHILDLAAIVRLARLIRTHRVDLLHAHDPRAAFLGRIAARLLGLPIIVTVHLPPYYYVRGQGVRARLKRWLYRHVERVLNYRFTGQLIYVSSRVCQEALTLGLAPRDRTAIVENGIDLAPFAACHQPSAVRAALNTPPEAIVLCCVGRLDEQKGIDILLEAASQLQSEKQICIWLAGDGPQRPQLENQVRQLGLEAAVRFLGFRSDVPELLKASDIFILPSRYEAMPMTVLEAMAAGLPTLVTDVGENASLVTDGVTGRIVPPQDPQALAGALSALIKDPVLCRGMGQAAQRKVQQYSAERMVARTLLVYEQALRKH